MLELIFGILFISVFWKIFKFAVKAAWGVSKIVVTVILLPLFLVGLVIKGLIYIALPILVIVGIGTLLGCRHRY